MKKVSSVDEYIEACSHFGEGLSILRQIITSTELEEGLKWNSPVYTLNGKNVLGISAFKNHFGIWFFNGVFLKDEKQLLVAAQKTTKALRQMRFKSIAEIDENTVLAYVREAIENQKLGKELKPERKRNKITIPKELKDVLKKDTSLNEAFKGLTPYKKREYAEYIEEAKRTQTKQRRLDKIIPMILEGHGLNDRHKKS